MPTMTAITQTAYGTAPEDVLRVAQAPIPEVDDGHVLVRVRAASVDRGTWHVMAGRPYAVRVAGFGIRRPKAANPGRGIAGTVEAVGAGVTAFAVGDAVFGMGDSAFAEFAQADPAKLARKPEHATWEQAAATTDSALTALQAVRDHARVAAGERVLVLGASGGVGTFAVQLATAAGAQVTGVASAAKADLVRSLGADDVLDYASDDLTAREPFDVVIDTGGNRPLGELRRALTPDGRLVIVGGETDGRWLGGADRQLRATLLSPFVSQRLGTFIASENADDLAELAELIDAGTLAPALDRTYPLAETPDAIRHLLDGRARGKIAITI